jgi:hypothetical protein
MPPQRISRWARVLLCLSVILAISFSHGWYVLPEVDEPPDPREKDILSRPENDATNFSAAEKACPWGEPVDGIACRLVVQPRYVIGQAITAAIELKNVSKKKRSIAMDLYLDPDGNRSSIRMEGPKGPVRIRGSAIERLTLTERSTGRSENRFKSIDAGEIKRFELHDLPAYFEKPSGPDARWKALVPGKYSLRLRIRSAKVTAHSGLPQELVAGQWAGEAVAGPVHFELAPLTRNDLVVHEWGVFTLFNDAKYANSNSKQEWDSLPNFFYRQYPQERLRWEPANWNKPIVYFYAKETPLRLEVKLTFADGMPVVWWPAVAEPFDEGGQPNSGHITDSRLQPMSRPYRSLTWRLWLGHSVPDPRLEAVLWAWPIGAWTKVEDFQLPGDCWLREARLPEASPLTVLGDLEEIPKNSYGERVAFPCNLFRPETERFLYYDGLVPAPNYLRCVKVDPTSITVRNRARFDIQHLFVVDRRTPGKVGFAWLDRTDNPLRPSTSLTVELLDVSKEDWPDTGIKQVKQALLEAGLFECECDALLKIWRTGFFEAEGVTVFYLLPQYEYERMLALEIVPKPAGKPRRVGIA